MKKNIVKLLLIIGIFTLSACGKKEEVITDASKFKTEYESLNETTNPNNDKVYPSMELPENNPIVYATYDDINELLDGKTGIIYFGYPECPWCRNAVPVLVKTAKKYSIEKIYYMNLHDERNKLSKDEDGNIVVENAGTEGYNNLVERIKDSLDVYEGLDDDTIKRIYVPLVLFVKDGKIIGTHLSTVDSQTDPYVALTEEQTTELTQIYSEYIKEISDALCDDAC